jgi:hypothetical protein
MGDSRLEPLVLSEAERPTLENWAKRRKTAQGLALRARIVLACADGGPNIAALMQQRAVHIEAGQVSTSPMPSGPES